MKNKTQNQQAARKKQILIVDDHPVFRAGLKIILEQEPGLAVCGEADTAMQAFQGIEKLNPDLVLTDIGLPGKSGVDLIHDIRSIRPELPVLVISMHDEKFFAGRVLRAGGRGYVMKQAGSEKILEAVHKVLEGKVAVSESVATAVLDSFSGKSAAGADPSLSRLSDREFEVLRLIGEGKDTHEIAESLHLSTKTVDTHRAHIRTKLGLKNGTELIHYAARWVGVQT